MDKQDFTMEQQVWQRVHAAREKPAQTDLLQLRREAQELAAIYGRLRSQLTGKPRELAARLHQGENTAAAILEGLSRLSRQGGEQLKLWQPSREDARKLVERCYHRTRQCMTEYLARSAEGECGVVFEKLAKQEAEHCALIAELLGYLG